MKILQVTYSFPPEPPAATDLYVESLCTYLTRLGLNIVIASPGPDDEASVVGGLRVRRFRHENSARSDDPSMGNRRTAVRFAALLDDEAPDVVHLHALTPACSPLLVGEARRRGIPTVFTLHTPTVICQRGTLLYRGAEPCARRVEVATCTTCAVDALDIRPATARALAGVPPAAGKLIEALGLRGGVWRALRTPNLIERRHAIVESLAGDVDRFVALSPWVENVLRVNGVPASKIVRSAHGLRLAPSRRAVWPRGFDHRLRLVHFGRVDPTKGTGLLIQAVRALPGLPLELDIFGVVQDMAGESLLEQFKAAAHGDARIRFFPTPRTNEVVSGLADYDMVVVPSQWMETGPLTVLEAFAAGVPVLGSDLGGIAEKVTDGVDGLLVRPFDSVTAWSAVLERAVEERSLITTLRRGVRPPRPALFVAEDMRALYASLVMSPRRLTASSA